MVNFMRRVFAFFAGVIFAFVLIVGALVGGGYYAFKNLSPKDVGMSEDMLGGLASMTFEEWTAFVMDVTKDPQSLTIKELKKQGFDTNAFLTSLGVDVKNANPKDLESFENLAIGALFGQSGLYEINMGILFLFIPKNAKTGKYPIFSEGARNRLRQYSLGDVFGGEATDNRGLSSILRSMKLGSILSSVYDEELKGGEFVYSTEDMGLELLANVELGLLTDGGEGGEGFNLGYEVKEGYLNSLEGKDLVEILASFGTDNEKDFNDKLDAMTLFGGIKFGDLFAYSTAEQKYAFTFNPVLEILTLGRVFGVQVCTQDDSCKVRHESGVHDGKLYNIGSKNDSFDTLVEGDNLQNTLYANLCSVSIVDIMGSNLDISIFLDGMVLGSAFGYVRCTGASDCPVHNDGDCGSFANKWFDKENVYVGNMLNDLASTELNSLLNGEGFDLNGILYGSKIGELFGYVQCVGENSPEYCPVHKNPQDCIGDEDAWFEWKNGEYKQIVANDVAQEVMLKLYNETLETMGEINIDSLMGDITLGKFLNLTYDEENDVWLDSNGDEVSIIYSSIAGLTISGLREPNAITGAIGKIKLGEFMGYEERTDGWYDANGDKASPIYSAIVGVTIDELMNKPNALTGALQDLSLGEFMGYEKRLDGKWYDKNGNKASPIYSAIAGLSVNDLMNESDALTGALEDLYLGELMGYVYEEYVDGEETKRTWYKVDEDGNRIAEVVGIDEIAANIKLGNVLSGGGELGIEDELRSLQIGEILGYKKNGDVWYDGNNPVPVETAEEQVLAQLYDKTLNEFRNNDISIDTLISGITFGEILGYTKNGEYWYDGAEKVDNTTIEGQIFYSIYDKDINGFKKLKIKDLMGNIKLGEFMGFKLVDETWYEKKDDNSLVPVSALYSVIANIKITDLMDNPDAIEGALNGLLIGDLVKGYTKVGNVWYDKDGNELKGVNKVIAEIKLEDVLSGNFEIKSSINELSVGEVMGLTKNGEFWYNGDVKVDNTTLNGKVLCGIYDTPIGKLNTLDISVILDDVYLGEFLGLEKDGDIWYEKNTNPRKPASVLYTTIADISVPDLLEDGDLITKKLEVLHGGDFIGYKRCNGDEECISECEPNCEKHVDCPMHGDGDCLETKGWYDTDEYGNLVEVTGIDKIAADILLGDVLSGNLNLDDKVQNLKLSDLINPNGNKVLEFLCEDGTTVNGLSSKVNDMTLGDVIEINDDSNKVLQYLGNTKVGELSTKVNEMTLGDVIDTEGNNMLSLLKDTKLDALGSKINSLYAGEIMGFTRCTGELGCPVHENAGCLATKNLWFEKNEFGEWILESGVEARVADLTIDQLSHHGITELNFVLGDVLKDNELDSGLFSLAYLGEIKDEYGNTKYEAVDGLSQIPVMELTERVSIGAETATYADLEHAGVIHLDEEVENSLDNIFGKVSEADDADGVWEGWTINETLNNLIVMQEVMNAYAITLADDFTHPLNTNVLNKGDVYVKVTKGEATITIHVAQSGQANVVSNTFNATHTLTGGKLLLIQ